VGADGLCEGLGSREKGKRDKGKGKAEGGRGKGKGKAKSGILMACELPLIRQGEW
jgi:hypothetical protein